MNADESCKQVRIYVDGIFDLYHFGHAELFEQAKKMYPNVYVIAGVMSDIDTLSNKGPTVMNEDERAMSVSHCKWVDEVIKCPPWIADQKFIEKYNIDYLAHDSKSYPVGSPKDPHKFIKENGYFVETKRSENISTSDLITRIIRNYPMYIERNLKRGVDMKDLNLSFWQRLKCWSTKRF
jgi:choline-phosphate cytidylyltransferase